MSSLMRISTEIRSWLAPMSNINFSTLSEYFFLHQVFSSPCQWKYELLPSLGVRCRLTFHILMFSSKTACPNEQKLSSYRNRLEGLLLKLLILSWSVKKRDNSCFWLVNIFKFFSSETQLPNEKNKLVGSTYGKFCIRFPQNRMKGEQQSVLAPRHVAVFNIGAYREMNNSFS